MSEGGGAEATALASVSCLARTNNHRAGSGRFGVVPGRSGFIRILFKNLNSNQLPANATSALPNDKHTF